MIAYLQGQLVEKHPARVVLDVGGVGYEALIPLSSFDRLPAEGASCRLLIHEHIREDAHLLFGFVSEAERRLFALLLSVTGIGPKLALSALSSLSVREIHRSLLDGDVKRLSSISGVGKKVAERLIVELKNKLEPEEVLLAGGESPTPADARLRDAALALVALGYKQADAQRMLSRVASKIEDGMAEEDVVRLALTG